MKRDALLRYLRQHGCELVREGGRHSWWGNPQTNRRSSIPRHSEIVDLLAVKICKDLGTADQVTVCQAPARRRASLTRRRRLPLPAGCREGELASIKQRLFG